MVHQEQEKFDPAKPFEVEGGFDPNAPFEVEERAPILDTSILENDPELLRLQEQLTPQGFTGGTLGGDVTTSVQRQIDERKEELLGISGGGAPDRVRKFSGSGLDAQQTIQTLLNQEFEAFLDEGEQVQLSRIPELDNALVFFDPQEQTFKRVDPRGLELEDITELRGLGIMLGTEVAGAGAGLALAGPVGAVAGGVLGAVVGEAARLIDGQAQGLDISDTNILIEALQNGGLSLAGGVTATVAARIIGLIRNGKRLQAVAEIQDVLGEAGADVVQAGRAGAIAAEAETGVIRTTAGQARIGAEATGAVTPSQVITDIERAATPGRGGGVIRRRTQNELNIRRQQDELLGGEPAVISDELLDPVTQVERRIAAAEGEAVRLSDQIFSGGPETQRIIGETIRDVLDRGRGAIGLKFNDEYAAIAREALNRGVVFDISNINAASRRFLAEAETDLFQSFSPESIVALKDIAKKTTLGEVDYAVFQRALSDLNTEIRLIQSGVSPRRNIVQLQKLRDQMFASQERAFVGHEDLLDKITDTNAAFRRLKKDVDGGLIGRIISTDKSGNFKLKSEDAIEQIISSPSDAQQLRFALDNPDNAFLALGVREEIRRGIHDLYASQVIKEGTIDPAAHAAFMTPQRRDAINLILGPDDIAKFDDAAGAITFIRDLRVQQQQIVKELNTSLGLPAGSEIISLRPRQLVQKIWNTKDPGAVQNAVNILEETPEALAAFKGAVRAETRRAVTTNGTLNANKLGAYIDDRGDSLRVLFGDEYVTALVDLRNSVLMTTVGKGLTSSVTEKSIGTAAATLRVFFAPLTARGRAFTAVRVGASKSQQQAFADILLDPDLFVSLSKQLKQAKTDRQILRVLGGFGLTGINVPRIGDEERPLQVTVTEPRGNDGR